MPNLEKPRPNLCFVHVVEGEVEPLSRQRCDADVLAHLRDADVRPEMIAVNAAGCFFVVDRSMLERVRATLEPLNVALFVRCGCTRIALTRPADPATMPSMTTLLSALSAETVDVVHFALEPDAIAALVPEVDCSRAAGVFSRFCRPRAA